MVTKNKEAATSLPLFKEYAIIATGGKQYQAIPGKTIAIEKITGKVGDKVEFAEVLLRKQAGEISIGQPTLDNPVKASIIKHERGKKLVVFKFKRRKKSRVKKGHRQEHTIVRIEAI